MKYIGSAKELIEEALFQLMETKQFSGISITDISQKAGVSRISFYRNYQTKEDIIIEFLNKSLTELSNSWDDSIKVQLQLFIYFSQNKRLLDILYKAHMQHLFQEHLKLIFNYNPDDENVVAYTKSAWASFMFGWMDEWYKRGMQESPQELIALMDKTYG